MSYEGCPHGKAHDVPCEACTAIWREHLARQAEQAELERIRREIGAVRT